MTGRPGRSIATGAGDQGTTRLGTGESVPKHDPRVEALGDVDELVAALGLARAAGLSPEGAGRVLALQRLLFRLGSDLAGAPGPTGGAAAGIGADGVAFLDRLRAELEDGGAMPADFIVPGAAPGGAALDFARAVARRVERRIVALAEAGRFRRPEALTWVNRLSDVLWLLARSEEEGGSTPLRPRP